MPLESPIVTLWPEREARLALAPRALRLAVLRPPYAALGVGALRVLRVRSDAATAEIVAGYERYERLPSVRR